MEFSILYAIQGLRCPFLDVIMLGLTHIVGSYGHLWVTLAIVLCIFKKTRKCGLAILLSYGLVFLIGQFVLKDMIARVRPCVIDQTVELLVARPTSFSCPSTHSAWSFAAASAVCMANKKAGAALVVLSTIIGFSRLYLFVHFPTDVFMGVCLGIFCGIVATTIVNAAALKLKKKSSAQ